jgi:hypothetical protein
MTCQHLYPLEAELIAAGEKETYRGAAWSRNCREWVYFDVVFDTSAIFSRMNFPSCVRIHQNLDQKSGTERGFECTECKDAIMGLVSGGKVYR